ncbi:alkaline phosphatase [Flavobacterium sp. 316]|uniref:VTT domain-containing protein n=1 Tax=Flavobacterium sediminilitoris TaxID=2024526 RepID=A0ABY4HPZ6_9FLAO|nr:MULTISPECIES: VTT domain-containing protein [Flavobacterium]KIX20744.1 alkaline phosphatase [Flavobacterium sp. 316]UOX34685.1 VTT domain-containing protein [Flavobacterium sediminilitoris]
MEDFHWTKLFNPEFYITMEINGVPIGIYMVLFIVFAETGLFAGFFLPGDSLLFLSGIYNRELIETFFIIPSDFSNVIILAVLIAIAATLGNIFGYWFGSRSGNYLYTKEDSFFFKKKYLIDSQVFFEKHGGKAIIFARFLPIIRTFVPIIAGIVHMKKAKFMFYNILSSIMWSFTLVFAGHYLYGFFLDELDIDLKKHIEKIILILIGVTTFPLVMKAIKSRKKETTD